MDEDTILYVAEGSPFSLLAAGELLRAWEGPKPGPAWRRQPQRPDRVELVGEDELRVWFGGWSFAIRWEEGKRGHRAVVEAAPAPRERFPSDEAYEDYSGCEYYFQLDDCGACLELLIEHFPGMAVHYPHAGWDWHGKGDPATAAPVPSHLANWLKGAQLDGTLLEATLSCPCGVEQLEFHYPGQTHAPGSLPCTAKYDNGKGGVWSWFAVQAVCAACRRSCLVFDSHRHGWNAFPCRKTEAELAAPLYLWPCLGCGSAVHVSEVFFRYDKPERFLKETDGRYAVERRADAFGWLTMNIRCCGCGNETSPWVDYETA